jgi:hypothetical protein
MANQDELLDRLQQLNESQIEELIYRLRVNRSHLSAGGASLNQKAIDLIRYLEPQVEGLQRLQACLEKLLPPHDLDAPNSLPVCPYRGLLAFQEQDAAFFFGREAFVDDWMQEDGSVRQGLVRAVETKPLVAVVGTSGSGKSSLVFAGLLPRLRQSGDWLIESFRPEKQPFFRLAVALMRQLEPELNRVDRIAKANDLADTIQKYGIANVVSEILQEHSGKQLLLVVDQFEELYTQCSVGERDRFIDALLEGLHKAIGLKVVLTLRADFCGQAYAYRPLADALQDADLKLGPMDREELQQAIERPAQLMEVEFEEGLTEWLLDDVGQEAGNLPLLEFALTELWKMQRQKTLTYQAYIRLGGVAKALANHADAVYAKLSQTDQKRAQRIFVQLVRPGDGTEDTRRVASRAEVGTDNWDLVAQLAGENARLVVTGRSEETVEIAHEALLREWGRLRKWMEQDRTFRVWQEGLRFTRRQWLQSGRDEAALLDGFLLSEAEEWQSQRREDLSSEEQEFIRLSQEMRDRRVQKRLQELQELVNQQEKAIQAETEATAQARKATRAERVKTRFAVATAGLAILALVTVGISLWRQQQDQKTIEAFFLDSNTLDTTAQETLNALPKLYKRANGIRKDVDRLEDRANIETAIAYYRDRQQEINRAFAYYRSILTVSQRLQTAVELQPKKFSTNAKGSIQTFSKQAESDLANLISKYRIPELKYYLFEKKAFGNRKIDSSNTDFEQKYTKGALQITYAIVQRESGAGADLNNNGAIDTLEEANQIPCETLREIEILWRKATNQRCGWLGEDSPYNDDDCELGRQHNAQLVPVENTLTTLVIGIPNEAVERIEKSVRSKCNSS